MLYLTSQNYMTYRLGQGMYKKSRVKNDRKFNEISAVLSCEQGNPEWEISK